MVTTARGGMTWLPIVKSGFWITNSLYGLVRLPKKNWNVPMSAIDRPKDTTIREKGPVRLWRSGPHRPVSSACTAGAREK